MTPFRTTAHGLLQGEIDAFDFVLGEKLSMSLEQVRALPWGEIEAWKAYFQVKSQQLQLEQLKAQARMNRGR